MGFDNANDRQHGGDHYRKNSYQHWDFVCDTGMHYLLGCATKYVSRWKYKGGVQDLEKAVHYLEKAMERRVVPPAGYLGRRRQFQEQLSNEEALAVGLIMRGKYEEAIGQIDGMIELVTPATPSTN